MRVLRPGRSDGRDDGAAGWFGPGATWESQVRWGCEFLRRDGRCQAMRGNRCNITPVAGPMGVDQKVNTSWPWVIFIGGPNNGPRFVDALRPRVDTSTVNPA